MPVADLIAKTPCAGLLPLTIGSVTVTECDPGPMTAIAPFAGQAAALGKALAKHGLAWPDPGQLAQGKGVELMWFGHAHALLIGAAPDAALATHAALTDQSDAWAVVQITGSRAADVLARLTPLDLRDAAFAVGRTARTELFHMAASVTRTGVDQFRVMVFRSMAETLVHDLKTAMQGVAARG